MAVSTLSALRAEVRELIGPGVYDRSFKDDWSTEGLNFACDQCCALLGLTRVENANVLVHNKHVVIPTDAVKIVSVIRYIDNGDGGYTMGKLLLESTIQTEDTNRPDWRSRTGEPTVWIQASGSLILLNGNPGLPMVAIGYIQRPTAMVNDTDTPDERIPEIFHQYLKYGAANYLLTLAGQSQDMEKAGQMFAKFAAGLGVAPLPLASKDVKR